MIGQSILHYKIFEKIGQGGMGVLYKAQDTKLDRPVAIKILHPDLTSGESDRERFILEAKATAALNHSNIATIHAIEEFASQLFIIMEYIQGLELSNAIKKSEFLSINTAIDYTRQMAFGLNAAHNKGIIHRDIKSSNIMITNDHVIKIMDFGLAQFVDGRDVSKGQATPGTIAYMAPEQIKGFPASQQTDIFSFGVVLYEMITAKLPFSGKNEAEILYAIINEEPPAVNAVRADCPSSLSDIITKCLEKEPKNRFQRMADILVALKNDSFQLAQSLASDKHNLPVQLTSFIGRTREIEIVSTLLSKNRLVTLTGAGGCGKSRLAIKVAARVASHYEDGVWLADLAPLSNPQRIPHTLATALSIPEEANVPVEEAVLKSVKDKKVLIILDNCEHLIAECSRLADMLIKSTNNMVILATSREALNVENEKSWLVPSLSLPDPQTTYPLAELSEIESIQLFKARATTAMPAFQISEKNANSVRKICTHLDGIPLAIELAAARIKLFGPEIVLDRLDRRFQLLTGNTGTSIERHRTLRAAIEWSYDLLDNKEQMLFNRLSVFAGSFDMAAVERVCSFEPLESAEILDVFSGLIEKSMVFTQTTSEGFYRYRLLETLRHFGMEKLASRDRKKTREKHYNYFLGIAEHAFNNRLGNEDKFVNQLELDHDNFIAALERVHKDQQKQLALAGALGWFWFYHSHFNSGIAYLETNISKCSKATQVNARALCGLGVLYAWSWHFDRAESFMKKCIDMWKKLGNEKETALALAELSRQYFHTNQFDKCRAVLEEGIELVKKLGDKNLLLHAETHWAGSLIFSSDIKRGESILERNLKTISEIGSMWDKILSAHFYSDCAAAKGDYKAGEFRYADAVKQAIKYGVLAQVANEVQGLSMCVAGQGRLAKGLRLFAASIKRLNDLGVDYTPIPFWEELISRTITVAREKMGEDKAKMLEKEGCDMDFEKVVEYALDFDKD